MTSARTLLLCACALLSVRVSASAQHKAYVGRTGLPTVFEGKKNVWVERGNVNLVVRGSNVYTYQDFRLHYPGGKLETGPEHCQVGVREDFFRSKDSGAGDVVEADLKGFSNFDVRIDGRRTPIEMKQWEINDKKDTATRWR